MNSVNKTGFNTTPDRFQDLQPTLTLPLPSLSITLRLLFHRSPDITIYTVIPFSLHLSPSLSPFLRIHFFSDMKKQ